MISIFPVLLTLFISFHFYHRPSSLVKAMDNRPVEILKAEMESIAQQLPLLPLPKEAAPRQIVFGEALKLEELGPIIINSGSA